MSAALANAFALEPRGAKRELIGRSQGFRDVLLRQQFQQRQAAATPRAASPSAKVFPPFLLDITNQCLWRSQEAGKGERLPLRPKAFAVLQYLVEHAGRLVTQAELLRAVWPDTFVQPEVLKYQIADIRHVLADNAKSPRFIETLPRRGYQFIAPVKEVEPTQPASLAAQAPQWFAEIQNLLTLDQEKMPPNEILGATRDRILREIRKAVDTLTSTARLFLALQDLHWPDCPDGDILRRLTESETSKVRA